MRKRGRSNHPNAAAVFVLAVACSAPVRVLSSSPVSPQPVASPAAPATPSSNPAPAVELVRLDPSHEAWTSAIDLVVKGAQVSVAVGTGRRISYLHLGQRPSIPASTEKLLTSMTALDTWGPSFRFATSAAARRVRDNGAVPGDLWVVGSGDPTVDATAMDRLADRIVGAGISRIDGSVIGDTSAFTREWWAPGWVPGLSRAYVNRTTALAFDGNGGVSPERQAAASLTGALEARGVEVDGRAMAGSVPATTTTVARIRSATLSSLLAIQNHGSVNFYAETILKALGSSATDGVGSTEAGAEAVESWADQLGVQAEVHDGSGLSYLDHITTRDMVTLLLLPAREPWGTALENSLPSPGEGTISTRLAGLDVHAKTGTLSVTPVSALAGYVTDASGQQVAFAIISRGLGKTPSILIEDAIVRILAATSMSGSGGGTG
jgi:serine-type D-Ala-D-Ala carboxypeptidase/endopeptidase (penicillin-binding protein 4)